VFFDFRVDSLVKYVMVLPRGLIRTLCYRDVRNNLGL